VTDSDIERMRDALHAANTDANKCRDALKDILRLCDQNRRGIVSEIETLAVRTLGELS
jgi:hypothetical protein